jgi:hypothetical protein
MGPAVRQWLQNNVGWVATVLMIVTLGALYIFLSWRGVVGFGIGVFLSQIPFRLKHGYWEFDREG